MHTSLFETIKKPPATLHTVINLTILVLVVTWAFLKKMLLSDKTTSTLACGLLTKTTGVSKAKSF